MNNKQTQSLLNLILNGNSEACVPKCLFIAAQNSHCWLVNSTQLNSTAISNEDRAPCLTNRIISLLLLSLIINIDEIKNEVIITACYEKTQIASKLAR